MLQSWVGGINPAILTGTRCSPSCPLCPRFLPVTGVPCASSASRVPARWALPPSSSLLSPSLYPPPPHRLVSAGISQAPTWPQLLKSLGGPLPGCDLVLQYFLGTGHPPKTSLLFSEQTFSCGNSATEEGFFFGTKQIISLIKSLIVHMTHTLAHIHEQTHKHTHTHTFLIPHICTHILPT